MLIRHGECFSFAGALNDFTRIIFNLMTSAHFSYNRLVENYAYSTQLTNEYRFLDFFITKQLKQNNCFLVNRRIFQILFVHVSTRWPLCKTIGCIYFTLMLETWVCLARRNCDFFGQENGFIISIPMSSWLFYGSAQSALSYCLWLKQIALILIFGLCFVKLQIYASENNHFIVFSRSFCSFGSWKFLLALLFVSCTLHIGRRCDWQNT